MKSDAVDQFCGKLIIEFQRKQKEHEDDTIVMLGMNSFDLEFDEHHLASKQQLTHATTTSPTRRPLVEKSKQFTNSYLYHFSSLDASCVTLNLQQHLLDRP